MGWKQAGFNIICNLVAVAILKLFGTKATGTEMGFWKIFFDFHLNYVVFFVIVNSLFFVIATNIQKSRSNQSIKDAINIKTILKDIWAGKTDNECALWNFGKYGYSAAPLNDTWQQWIKGLLVTTNRPDLDYHNFGEEFYFFDMSTGKNIEIPTGNKARSEKTGGSIRVGMVLRLMPMIL